MTIDLDSFVAAPGEYLICFDAQGPDNTWGNFIRGLTDEADGMGKWPDGTNLPARATNATSSVTIRWAAGLCADSHDVYFGTSYNGVLNANHASPEYKGNQTTALYDAGTLAYNTTYYWSID